MKKNALHVKFTAINKILYGGLEMEKYKDNELYPFLREYVARMIYAGCTNPYVIEHLRLGYGIELTEKDITEIMNDV